MVQGVLVEKGCLVDVNPATGEVIDRVPLSTPAEVDAAVAAARKAQVGWSALTLEKRTDLVKAAVRKIGERPELARLITREMGKTLAEAEEEVGDNSNMDEYADLVMEANAPEQHGSSVIVRQAHGVVGICAPWNFPVEEIVLLSIPALVAGNAIVVKPSEVVPLSGKVVVGCLMEGLNNSFPGLVGLLQGDGSVGSYMVAHPDVDMVAFTGSTATGAKILKVASETLKPVVLECGGKDPMVVLEDADLDKAAEDAVAFSLMNCGQVCCAVERIYVAESVEAAFSDKVVAIAKTWVAGDGLDPETSMGPLVSEMQRQVVDKHVKAAVGAGAKCLLGGSLPDASAKGTFYPPTVLSRVPHEGCPEITQEETFGPVVAISSFSGGDDAAVALANDSTYGLTASVYSGDVARAGRVAARLSAGQVGINQNALSGNRHALCPFVGHKKSGYGSHSGRDGWRQFSSPKSLLYAVTPSKEALPKEAVAPPPLPGSAAAESQKWQQILAAVAGLALAAVVATKVVRSA